MIDDTARIMPTLTDLATRLQRTESRIVAGFTALGIQVVDDVDWFKCEGFNIFLKSGGKTLSSIQIAMRKAGCAEGQAYVLNVGGEQVGTIILPRGSWR